jgi:hypothetical protein
MLPRTIVLLVMGNSAVSGNKLLAEGVLQLKRRLPPGWAVELNRPAGKDTALDGYVRLRAPDRRVGRLAVETKERLDPRGVAELAAWRSRWSRDRLVGPRALPEPLHS